MSKPIRILQARIARAIAAGETAGSLARKAGLHRNALYGYADENWDPKMSTVAKLDPHLPE